MLSILVLMLLGNAISSSLSRGQRLDVDPAAVMAIASKLRATVGQPPLTPDGGLAWTASERAVQIALHGTSQPLYRGAPYIENTTVFRYDRGRHEAFERQVQLRLSIGTYCALFAMEHWLDTEFMWEIGNIGRTSLLWSENVSVGVGASAINATDVLVVVHCTF